MKFQWRKIPKHWKYQLTKDYHQKTKIRYWNTVRAKFITLFPDGQIVIKKGYAWDGSTVVMDTKACMRPSLVHDALCQLIDEGLLNIKHREAVDKLYRDMCIADGMWKWHADLRYWGLRKYWWLKQFGKKAGQAGE